MSLEEKIQIGIKNVWLISQKEKKNSKILISKREKVKTNKQTKLSDFCIALLPVKSLTIGKLWCSH